MSVKKNLTDLLQSVELHAKRCGRNPEEIAILAVSKGKTIEEMSQAYWAGIKDFGESRIPEAMGKIEKMPLDTRWHFVGKLQKNKVSKAIGRFALIHSVDTPELAEKISKSSITAGLITNILLESNTSGESAKSGLSPKEWEEAFNDLLDLGGIEIHGLMTMAPLTEDEGVIRHAFSELRFLRDRLQMIAKKSVDLTTLSMGMSNDYPLAIQEGATLLRIGTFIFSPR